MGLVRREGTDNLFLQSQRRVDAHQLLHADRVAGLFEFELVESLENQGRVLGSQRTARQVNQGIEHGPNNALAPRN